LSALAGGLNLHVIAPTHVLDGHGLEPGDLHFRKIMNKFEGSAFASFPELINPNNKYFEWFLSDTEDHDEAISDAICYNQPLQGFSVSNWRGGVG
jgi:hypothetical protein